jgi:large-conductance mechanosensitive channel
MFFNWSLIINIALGVIIGGVFLYILKDVAEFIFELMFDK